jgi:hypothetical protein
MRGNRMYDQVCRELDVPSVVRVNTFAFSKSSMPQAGLFPNLFSVVRAIRTLRRQKGIPPP